MLRLSAILFLLTSVLVETSCHNHALVASPPPPTPTAAPTAPEEPAKPKEEKTEQEPPPDAQPKPPAKPVHRATTPAASVASPGADPPKPEYRLGQAMSPEEARDNNALIDQHLQRANQVLASLANRNLTDRQKNQAAQIRAFIARAEQLRAKNLQGARSLAEKADTLAADLMSRLQ